MGKIWITSDWHFGHNKEFLYRPRGYSDTYKMSVELVDKYNSLVQNEDEVFFLGDAMLNDNDFGKDCLSLLNGHIHFILGNHDTENRQKIYSTLPNIVEICYARPLKYKGYTFWLSHYPSLCGNHDIDTPLKNQTICLCGHTHTKNQWEDINKGLIYHCEVDAHNNEPICIDDILMDLLIYKTIEGGIK